MMGRFRGGFTIIEVMLFLAISGALAAAILIGTGVALAQQRYKDAVASVQSDIQQQYEDVVSVKNNRVDSDDECQGARGRSNCVLIGKMLTITADGTLRDYRVYGVEPTTVINDSTTMVDEYGLMRSYDPRITVVGEPPKESQMEWATGISQPGAANPGWGGVGILVLRSPQSGRLYTFTRDSVTTGDLAAMIDPAQTAQRILCVAPNGWAVADRMAVIIGANAASANAVEFKTNTMLSSEGVQCG